MIHVFVPGDPKPQPRPRAFARKMGGRFVARVYDDSTAEGWKAQIALALKPWVGTWHATGPVHLTLQFLFRRPSSHFRRDGVTLTKSAPLAHLGRPDADNLAKAVLDCCTMLGLWDDDSQVTWLIVRKQYDYAKSGVWIDVDENQHYDGLDVLALPDIPDEQETIDVALR